MASFFVSDGELDYFLTTFHGVLRFAGKILVQFIGDMERIFLFQMSISVNSCGGGLVAAVAELQQHQQQQLLLRGFVVGVVGL